MQGSRSMLTLHVTRQASMRCMARFRVSIARRAGQPQHGNIACHTAGKHGVHGEVQSFHSKACSAAAAW
eukprot:360750-Chlamydomonas_euryale.AAC.9